MELEVLGARKMKPIQAIQKKTVNYVWLIKNGVILKCHNSVTWDVEVGSEQLFIAQQHKEGNSLSFDILLLLFLKIEPLGLFLSWMPSVKVQLV